MRFILTDLKRIFTEPAFFLSIFFSMILLMGAFAYLVSAGNTDRLFEASQAFALPFAAPVLAAMPYSVMIMQEKKTRFSSLMILKLGSKGYHLRRLLTCGISGGAVLFIPHLILYAVCKLAGYGGEPSLMLLSVTFGFGYAVFSYGLTFVNSQRYVPMVMPQVIYLLCIYAFPVLKLEKFYPPLDIAPSIYGGEITADRFVIPLILTVCAVALTVYGKAGDSE